LFFFEELKVHANLCLSKIKKMSYFYFHYRESIVIAEKNIDVEISMNLHELRSQESEIEFFSFFFFKYRVYSVALAGDESTSGLSGLKVQDETLDKTRLGHRCVFSGSCVIKGTMEGNL